MDEQKLQVVNHPLFGEIQVSQSENGKDHTEKLWDFHIKHKF